MSTSALQFLRYDLDDEMDYPDGGLALDLSELKCLRSLEVDINEFHSSLTAEVFSSIIHTLNSSPPSTLHDLTLTFTSGEVKRLALVWKDPTAVEKFQLLEDTLIGLGKPRLVVKIPQAKRNRLAIWSEWICSCFPRLHERKLLRVQCSFESDDGQGHLGHDASVLAAAASPDGRYIATSAEDDTIIIWSGMPLSQTVLVEIQCPELRINPLASYNTKYRHITALAFSDTGEFLAAGNDSDLLIYRVADGSLVTSIGVGGPALSCAWQSDGLDHAILSVLGYTANDPTFHFIVRMWVQLPGDPVHSASRPAAFSPPAPVVLDDSESVGFPQLSPSGRTVAGTSFSDQVCHIWRMVARVAPTPEYEVHHLTYRSTEPDVAPSCASLVDDDQLVVVFRDGTIRWWDISVFPASHDRTVRRPHTASRRVRLRVPQSDQVVRIAAPLLPHRILASSTDGMGVAARGELGLGASQSGLSNVKLSLHASLQGRTGPIWAACFSPCERYVATASWNTVRLWSVGDGSLVWTFEDHDARVSHLVFTPDGKSLVLADEDGRVCVHALCMFVRDAPLCLE